MKILMSEFNRYFDSINAKGIKNYLIAFAGRNIYSIIEKISNIEESFLMVDNGAFSVWKSGKKEINIKSYIDECKKIKDSFNFECLGFIALDKIPGSYGKKPSKSECELAVKYTKENYIYMRKELIDNVYPVFHQHDDFSYLDFYLDNTDFICISPANDVTNKGREIWLDKVFEKIDVKNSKVKTHGLAVTGKYLCEKYPFYSVDSISWSAPALYGRVNVWKNFKIETLTKSNCYDSIMSAHCLNGIMKSSSREDCRVAMDTSLDTFLELEDYITKLWEEKGIIWN